MASARAAQAGRGCRSRSPTPTSTRPPSASRKRSAESSRSVADRLGALLRRLLEPIGVLLPGLLGGVRSGLSRVLRDLLAVLDRLGSRALDLLGHLIGHGPELLVLDSRARDDETGDEAECRRADGEPERVLLGDADRLLRALFHLTGVRSSAHELVLDARHSVLGARLDVRLVGERIDGAAHSLACVLDVSADHFRFLAHRTSSFTVSTV